MSDGNSPRIHSVSLHFRRWSVSLGLMMCVAAALLGTASTAQAEDSKPTLAVFPFENRTNDQRLDSLAQPLADLMVGDIGGKDAGTVAIKKWSD